MAAWVLVSASWLGTTAGVVVGTGFGFLAGTGAATGVVVARARFQNRYVESTRDIVSWQGAPIPLGAVAGGAVGAAGGGVLAATVAGAVVMAGAGATLGVAGAAVLADGDPADLWAGGTMGGAAGIMIGFLLGWLAGRRRDRDRSGGDARSGRRAGRGATTVLLSVLALSSTGCGERPAATAVEGRPVPADPAAVESVVLLIGDPGKARFRHYPVIPRVAAAADEWSQRIGRDSAVTVLVLGDVVYPEGLHEPGAAAYPTDSARVADQVEMVQGGAAQEHAARLLFLAGNHDWGLLEDRAGARRLRNLGAFVDRERGRGANVDLVPPAGTGGPTVVDVGANLRLILLDTAWWLFDAEPDGKQAVLAGVRDALRDAGRRRVVIAAHHPFESAGPHGGLFPVWRTLGIRYLLYRSGAMLQDLQSRPYRALRRQLGEVYRDVGRPLVFAGGHEHSLQVMAHDTVAAPRYSLVSGSASKLTGVGMIPGTMYQASRPGYMTLVVRQNGAVDLQVTAAAPRFLTCPENDPTELDWESCMARGEAAFEPVYSARLAGPAPVSESRPARPRN